MRTVLFSAILTASACVPALAADQPPALSSPGDRVNYSVGYQIGGDFKRQGVELNPDALVQGVRDALAATATPLMSSEEMRDTLVALKKKIDAVQDEQRKREAMKNLEEGRAFLAENRGKEGVFSLASGLQYRIIEEGSGRSPKVDDTVTVHYRGTLIGGSEFDSSHRRKEPATVGLKTVIPGWREALPLMREGARWQLFLPPQLAFGEQGPLADKVVIYEVELLSVAPANK